MRGDIGLLFCKEYRLFSPSGMEVVLLEAGAAITSVRTADRNGAFANVALPLESADDPSCAGVTLAPYAGRIAGGLLRIGGETVQLSINEGGNQLHGGAGSLAHKLWRCEGQQDAAHHQQITFCAEAEDGLDGFPGNRRFSVTYRLYDDQRLELTLRATTDKPTRVNLSNHAYFNLSGDFSSSAAYEHLQLQADEVYLNDGAFLASGRCAPPPALDYRLPREVGGAHGDAQREGARGLNHCYVLRGGAPAATLTDPASGRRLRLYTDQPCVTVYSGGFLPAPGCAIALEAQEHPESPYAPPTAALLPGEVYIRRIVYRFDAVD
ncbi:MAG: aldose epimerase family protein [Candidatus Ventricola sp.]